MKCLKLVKGVIFFFNQHQYKKSLYSKKLNKYYLDFSIITKCYCNIFFFLSLSS